MLEEDWRIGIGRVLGFRKLRTPQIFEAYLQTRLLSLKAVVDRIIEQWPALIIFFTSVSYEDATMSAQNILGALNNLKLNFYFNLLHLVNKWNVEFQSESTNERDDSIVPFDEASLYPHLDYKPHLEYVSGIVSISPRERYRKIVNHALVFILSCISHNWKRYLSIQLILDLPL